MTTGANGMSRIWQFIAQPLRSRYQLRFVAAVLFTLLAAEAVLSLLLPAADAAVISGASWTVPLWTSGPIVVAPTGNVLAPGCMSVRRAGDVAWTFFPANKSGCEAAVGDAQGNSFVQVSDTVYKVDSGGNIRWTTSTGGWTPWTGSNANNPILGATGSVYFAEGNGTGTTKVLGFDQATGARTFDQSFSYVAGLYAYSGGIVVLQPPSFEPQISYIPYDNSTRQTYGVGPEISHPVIWTSSALAADGVVYIAGYPPSCAGGFGLGNHGPTNVSVAKVTPAGIAWKWTDPVVHACDATRLAATTDGGVILAQNKATPDPSADFTAIDSAGSVRWTHKADGPQGPAGGGGFLSPRVDANGVVALPSTFSFPCSGNPAQECSGAQVEFVAQSSGTTIRPSLRTTDPNSQFFSLVSAEVDTDRVYVTRDNAPETDGGSVSSFDEPGLSQDYRLVLQAAVLAGSAANPSTIPSSPPDTLSPSVPLPPQFPCKPRATSGKEIRLLPSGRTLVTGRSATFTARVAKVGPVIGQPRKKVTFKVDCGPNAGRKATSTTDAHGETKFTYRDTHGTGTDKLSASFVNAAHKTERAIATITWATPVNPCSPIHGGIGKRLLTSLNCTKTQVILETRCGATIAGFVFIPLKLLNTALDSKGLVILSKLPRQLHASAELYNKLSVVKYLPGAPKSLSTPKNAHDTFDRLKKVRDFIKLLPDLRQAVSSADFNEIALDIADVAGLRPCVQAVVNGLR
jgi:hypothetical protein